MFMVCVWKCVARIVGRCEYMCNMFYDRHMVNSMHFMIYASCVYSMHVWCMYVVVMWYVQYIVSMCDVCGVFYGGMVCMYGMFYGGNMVKYGVCV